MDHPHLPLPDRSEEIDKTYGVLGRALAYATEFENNCRKLAHLLDIQSTDHDFGFEIYMLTRKGRLFEKIERIKQTHNIAAYTARVLHDSRKSRNYIAHEAAEDHVTLIKTEEGRRWLTARIIVAVQTIAEGNQVVLDLIWAFSCEPRPTHGSEIVQYQLAVWDWVGP